MKTGEREMKEVKDDSSVAGTFLEEGTAVPSMLIAHDAFILTTTYEVLEQEEPLEQDEPNEASRRAIEQSLRGELNTYGSLEEFREHLRTL